MIFDSAPKFRLAFASLVLACVSGAAQAQAPSAAPLKVGVMLPFTGTYAPLGVAPLAKRGSA